MKYISIITGTPLTQVQGVNYFIKSFLGCNKLFKNVIVNRVYSAKQCLHVDEGDAMPIGSDVGTTEYKVRTFVRTTLRKLLTSKFYPFALFRYELNRRYNSKKSVEYYFRDEVECDCIIFQEMSGAEYYFKHIQQSRNDKRPKTMLVIHSEDDSCRMLLEKFEGYGRRDMERRLMKIRDFVYKNVDKVIYISKKAYNSSIMPIEKRGFVYNGSPNIEYQFTSKLNDDIQFVCVGSMDGRKGQDVILQAMGSMDECTLQRIHVTFIGDGSELGNLQNMSSELGLSPYVTFAGQRDDVPDLLRDKDVFIMPSTAEGLPMSAIEALRAGLFLILTDTGGNAELCDEGCGFVCTRNPMDVKKKMMDVIGSSIVSMDQKEKCRSRFLNEYSLEKMSENYENLILSL